MTQERPKLNIPLTQSARLLEVLAIVGLLAFWGLTIYFYPHLPETIPVHFNFKGEIDDYGHKKTLWILPIIATLLYALLTIFNRYPHMLNYPVQITTANAERYYTKSTKLLRIIKLLVVIVFLLIEWIMIQAAV